MPTSTTRLGLVIPASTDNESLFPSQATTTYGILDNTTIVTEGTLASRPLASSVEHNHVYRATDVATWFVSDGTNWNTLDIGQRGAVSIPTSESRTNTAFGTLTTPDQVTGLTLPTNGLIAVWYQAMWQSSAGTGQAAIFLGSNQLQVQGFDNATGHQPLPQFAVNPQSAINQPLFSFFGGLGSGTSSTGFTSDTTTGQVVGYFNASGGQIGAGVGVLASNFFDFAGTTANVAAFGGPCYIFAAAGTYTVSVQYKSSSGSVTVANRRLWVRVLSFA